MAFRGHDGEHREDRVDPLARFFELEAALDAERGMFGDLVPLRLAAANLVMIAGEPEAIAASIRATTKHLHAMLPLLSAVSHPVQLLIAAVLLQRGDDPVAFLAEVERVRALMRGLAMRRFEIFEITAILALRIRNALQPISVAQVERMRAIYDAMKRHHWLLTGPDDYPACAFLVGQDRSPEDIAARANAIYEGLRREVKLWRGDPLQTASNVLALSPLEPAELVDRFQTLAVAVDEAGYRVRQAEYDEVALLCFLARPAAKIVETVVGYAEAIRERLRWAYKPVAFGLATNLAFVRLVGDDPELGALADAKMLLDMQTVLAARQAAATA